LSRLAVESGFTVESMRTMVSPVNWTYTVHNLLADKESPDWLRGLFTLKSPFALGFFTLLDTLMWAIGRGALLRASLRKPWLPDE
jgi:hypothetical protein